MQTSRANREASCLWRPSPPCAHRQVEFRREHLRAPPRGYHCVRDERGDTLLIGIATAPF
ncbi:MAG TPA: RcnB family protein [Vitreimonas sp.]|nr:RcnB family protein [Vitreimonas sp.]